MVKVLPFVDGAIRKLVTLDHGYVSYDRSPLSQLS